MSTNRILVDAKLHDELVDRFTAHVKGLKYGDPKDPSVFIGPIINQKQLKSLVTRIEGARSAGAREVLGGDPQGQVLPPHVFVNVTNDMAIAQEESFGPLAPIIKVNEEADALRVANNTESSHTFLKLIGGQVVQELRENRSARVHSPFLHFTYFPSAKAVFDSFDFKSKKTKIPSNSLPCIALAESLKPSSGQYWFVPYTLRHTALTRFGEAAGNNIFTVAQIAGHASLTTTKRYVHPQAEAIDRVFAASQLLVGTKLGTPKKLPAQEQRKKSL